jgi:hypothetical protein
VAHLRCSASYIPRTQRSRAGLKYVAPTALERRPSRHGAEGEDARDKTGCFPYGVEEVASDEAKKKQIPRSADSARNDTQGRIKEKADSSLRSEWQSRSERS